MLMYWILFALHVYVVLCVCILCWHTCHGDDKDYTEQLITVDYPRSGRTLLTHYWNLTTSWWNCLYFELMSSNAITDLCHIDVGRKLLSTQSL